MTYLFIGESTSQKQTKIIELKAQLMPAGHASSFDYEGLYGHRLDPKELKKSLLALPAISDQRLIFIHEADKLNEHCKEILLEFLNSQPQHAVLILDCAALSEKDAIWGQIRRQAKVFETVASPKENVFDMTRQMLSGRTAEALKVLNSMYDDGVHPLQIMGGVIWAWGNEKPRLRASQYEKGLRELQEADMNIKRSRLKPEQAVEVLVVKLASLRS